MVLNSTNCEVYVNVTLCEMTINILKTLKSPTSKEKWGEWRDFLDTGYSQKNYIGHLSIG